MSPNLHSGAFRRIVTTDMARDIEYPSFEIPVVQVSLTRFRFSDSPSSLQAESSIQSAAGFRSNDAASPNHAAKPS